MSTTRAEQWNARADLPRATADDSCWHCGAVLAGVSKPRCESCPDECDIEGCDAFGCVATPRTTANNGDTEPDELSCPDCAEGKITAGCSIDKPLISVDCGRCKGTGRIKLPTINLPFSMDDILPQCIHPPRYRRNNSLAD